MIDFFNQDELSINQIISIRQKYRLKLPDAIIAAAAIQNLAQLISDVKLNRVTELTVLSW